MTPQERAQDIKGAIVAVIAFLTALWGWIGWAMILLAAAMLVDYITGSAAAKAKGEWSSEVARAGLRHKLGEIIAVGAAAFADLGVRVVLHSADVLPLIGQIGWPDCFTMIVALWYFFTELGSIIENAGKLGAPIPDWMKKGVAVLQAKTGEAGEKIGSGQAAAQPASLPKAEDPHAPDPETGGTATEAEILADLAAEGIIEKE